jgi:hypothetical protein
MEALDLVLERLQLDDDVTIGSLTLDGQWQCWTLEDPVREPGIKVPGNTAIPPGSYSVVITHSPRFKRLLPLLQRVPGFEGVRIHAGNTAAHTEGCILVGADRHPKSVGRSRLAFDALFVKLQAAQKTGRAMRMIISSPAGSA